MSQIVQFRSYCTVWHIIYTILFFLEHSDIGFAVFVQPHHYITQIFLLYIYIRLKIFFTVCKNIATIQEKAKPESICQHHKWDPVRQLQLEINDPVILGYVYRILYNKEDIEICFLGYCQCAFWNLLKLE